MPDMKRVGVLLVAFAMTGCSGGGSTPPEASTTPSSATPSVSKSVSPSEDPLYLEAVEVYKKLFDEERKLLIQGGAESLPPSMVGLLADPAMSELQGAYQQLKTDGVRIAAQPAVSPVLSPNPGVKVNGSAISLKSCEDSSSVETYASDGSTEHGMILVRTVFFERMEGSLRVNRIDVEDGTSCGS